MLTPLIIAFTSLRLVLYLRFDFICQTVVQLECSHSSATSLPVSSAKLGSASSQITEYVLQSLGVLLRFSATTLMPFADQAMPFHPVRDLDVRNNMMGGPATFRLLEAVERDQRLVRVQISRVPDDGKPSMPLRCAMLNANLAVRARRFSN